MSKESWTIDKLLHYAGLRHTEKWRNFFQYFPVAAGLVTALCIMMYHDDFVMVFIGLILGALLTRLAIEFALKGFVEDQLISAVETFPDFLQVFIIGLNSGLNHYNSFQFAYHAMDGVAPDLVMRELTRTKLSLDLGESHAKVWSRLGEVLPFELLVDFCEIMVISHLHGESIVKSINQMMNAFQVKKLNLVEKKANKLGQMVIPVIVLAFFPLFIFSVFGPLWLQLANLF